MKYKVWMSILLSISLLAGCSLPLGSEEKTTVEKEEETLGLTPDFSYEVVEQTPNILINQIGYLTENNKIAILQGNQLENVFYVYQAQSNALEYVGELMFQSLGVTQDKKSAKDIYLADFSHIKTPGRYYLYHPKLGYSYEFEIKNDIYDNVEKKILSLLGEEKKDTSLICYQLAGLLLTKELYPEAVLQPERLDRICREKVELLLKAQDETTGNVYADISKADILMDEIQKQQFVSLAATAEFAGVMANYAFQIREKELNLSYQYQMAAEKAYDGIRNSLDNVGYDAGYFAATQLYRLTGRTKYAQAIGQYLTMNEEQKRYTEYDFSLFGDYAYLTLRYGSNLEWSDFIMKRIMKQAETISRSSGKNNFYVSDKREYNDIDGKLRDMSNLALVNYIITNHEYSVLQQNYLDYFLGRNPDNICYIDGFGTRNAGEDEAKIQDKNGSLFYLLLQGTKL